MILTDGECANALGMDLKEWHGRPWTQKDARAIESAVLRKLRERPANAWLIDWPDEPELGHYLAEGKSDTGRNRSLHIIPEVNE